MPRSRGKKAKNKDAPRGQDDNRVEESSPPRAGLPDDDSILEEKAFVSPSGKKYRILKTDETDEYEEPESKNQTET